MTEKGLPDFSGKVVFVQPPTEGHSWALVETRFELQAGHWVLSGSNFEDRAMRSRYREILGTIVLILLYGTEAWAEGPAPVRPADRSPLVSLLLFFPIVFFLGVLFVMMRRASKAEPKMDRSLELCEESVRLGKEQVALQTETNRLLARLIETQARD